MKTLFEQYLDHHKELSPREQEIAKDAWKTCAKLFKNKMYDYQMADRPLDELANDIMRTESRK